MKLNVAFIAVAMLLLTACAPSLDVSTQVSSGVHLNQYKTYKIQTGPIYDVDSAEPKPGDQTEVGRILEEDLRQELERHGLRPGDEHADLVFSYVAGKRLGHWGEHQWPYKEGAADLTATDSTGRTVWISHLQAVIDPADKTHRQLKDAIHRAFKNYPFITVRQGKEAL